MIITGDMPTESGAKFSPDRRYRYCLWRNWDANAPHLLVIGLNPSTADGTEDGPTIRKCKKFAKRWNCGGLVMVNLFALRATEPKEMIKHPYPIGRWNNEYLHHMFQASDLILAAWGRHGHHLNRGQEVMNGLRNVDGRVICLPGADDVLTANRQPRHPLYLKDLTTPVELFGHV